MLGDPTRNVYPVCCVCMFRNHNTSPEQLVYYAPPTNAGALSDDAVWRLSVAYIRPKSTTQRPRKTKTGRGSPRHTWLGHHFQGPNVKGQGHQAAAEYLHTSKRLNLMSPTDSLLQVLRQTKIGKLSVQRTAITIGRRNLDVSGPDIWNSLPTDLRLLSVSTATFARHLKAHLLAALNDMPAARLEFFLRLHCL